MKRSLVAFFLSFFLLTLSVIALAGDEVPTMRCVYTKGITVDGDLAEWNKAYPIELTEETVFVYAGQYHEFSGQVYAAWDDEYLYFAGEIVDDDITVDFWAGDRWGFVIDAFGDTTEADYATADDWIPGNFWLQFRVSPESRRDPERLEVLDKYKGLINEVVVDSQVAVVFTDEGYIFEVAYPWAELSFLEEPFTGREIGFVMIITDGDTMARRVIMNEYIWGAQWEQLWRFWDMGKLILID